MTGKHEDSSQRALNASNSIEILIYRSTASGIDGTPRFIAHGVRYGQVASGRTPNQALARGITLVVSYLIECRQNEISFGEWPNWAPHLVRDAWLLADNYEPADEDIAEIQSQVGFEIDRDFSVKFEDMTLAQILIKDLSLYQAEGQSLEETVEAGFGA